MVASHLEGDKPLIAVTHVCHLWRLALISCPYLWSNITFGDERRALVFTERSKAVLISVHIRENSEQSKEVKESLMRVTDRLATLRAERVSFLGELLIKPLPKLRTLDVVTSGGFTSVNLCRPLFHVPNLTNFRFAMCRSGSEFTPRLGDSLLGFLRSCPLLEVAFFGYGDPENDMEFTTGNSSSEVIPLPCLRSFTHESPVEMIPVGLFNRLSLPSTCNITFTVTDRTWQCVMNPWDIGFIAFPPYLSDVKMVKIRFHLLDENTDLTSTTFFNSERTSISLSRLIPYFRSSLALVAKNMLAFLQDSRIAHSIETLHFECDQVFPGDERSRLDFHLKGIPLILGNLKTLVLQQCDPVHLLEDLSRHPASYPHIENLLICMPLPTPPQGLGESYTLERVLDIAMPRNKQGTPLKIVSLCFQGTETLSHSCMKLIEELRNCVELVKVVELNDWKVDGV